MHKLKKSEEGEASLEEVFQSFVMSMRDQVMERLRNAGVTPPMAGTLQFLERPMSMKSLADHIGCDASNITGIADRLEAKGLVTRNVDPNDRRVKVLKLTPEGERLRDTVFRHGLTDVGIDRLTGPERKELARLLRKITRP
jgi:DNA-binding MarR family transcriptional regulator